MNSSRPVKEKKGKQKCLYCDYTTDRASVLRYHTKMKHEGGFGENEGKIHY